MIVLGKVKMIKPNVYTVLTTVLVKKLRECGNLSSSLLMSSENLFKTLPVGVVSKKDIGDFKIEVTNSSCMAFEALMAEK